MINALINETLSTVITFALILAGLPVYYFAFGRARSRSSRADDARC